MTDNLAKIREALEELLPVGDIAKGLAPYYIHSDTIKRGREALALLDAGSAPADDKAVDIERERLITEWGKSEADFRIWFDRAQRLQENEAGLVAITHQMEERAQKAEGLLSMIQDRLLRAFGDLKPSERSAWIDIEATIKLVCGNYPELPDSSAAEKALREALADLISLADSEGYEERANPYRTLLAHEAPKDESAEPKSLPTHRARSRYS